MRIDKTQAIALVRQEAAFAVKGPVDAAWNTKIEKLSRLCEEGVSKTHIAFLGTEIIAKSMDKDVDLYAIKPEHAKNNPNAFSARTLCHSVLVPLAAEIGINLGVTGREPLNNQPYFRMTRLGDDTPVHAGGRAAFTFMLELVKELQALKTEAEAQQALRAFISVRRKYQPRYAAPAGESNVTPEQLTTAIKAFVAEDSEHGKRAQAVVAGLMDVFAGVERVESGRINDPSRKYPGDVCVRSASDPDIWDKAMEVRDKPVAASDIQIFAKKCVDMAVREAAVVMAAEQQSRLNVETLGAWAAEFGIGLTLFHGWDSFVEQTLFWADLPKPDAANKAVGFIHERLLGVEAAPSSVALWDQLTQK
jgi:SacI restriction endonuclease